jgi:hypothetical protein
MSYAAGRTLSDLDPDPVPTHESPDRGAPADAVTDGADTLPEGLPKRRRGQALAEAERSRARAESVAPETPRPAPSADDTLARTARFNSFRQAVRDAATDQGTRASDTDADSPVAAEPTPSLSHSEGNPTS